MGEYQRRAEPADAVADSFTRPEGVITFDAHGGIVSFDAAAEGLFGYAAAEIMGQQVTVLIAEPTYGQRAEVIAAALHARGTRAVGRRKDGAILPLELAVGVLCLRDRLRFIGLVRDATNHKRCEEELRIASKLATASTLAGGIDQGLNILLTLIMGHISLAKTYVVPSDKAWANLTVAEHTCKRAADLAHQLLTLRTKELHEVWQRVWPHELQAAKAPG
jgi:PAS domain S-box-containing protein